MTSFRREMQSEEGQSSKISLKLKRFQKLAILRTDGEAICQLKSFWSNCAQDDLK
jgi:hypothetical protein